jgi:hypothetical protein
LATRLAGVLIKKILKFYLVLFVTGGVNVSYVIGDDVKIKLLGLHPGRARVKR